MKFEAKYTRIEVNIPLNKANLNGELTLPEHGNSVVIIIKDTNQADQEIDVIVRLLNNNKIATLVIKSITDGEYEIQNNHFNLYPLKDRLIKAAQWIKLVPEMGNFKIGFFGRNSTAACALIAAAELKNEIRAVVTRSARADMAEHVLYLITAPTLLIAGELDDKIAELNVEAYTHLISEKKISIIEGASNYFTEPGKSEEAAIQAAEWFIKYL